MNRLRRLLFCVTLTSLSSVSFAQSSFDDSGIAAGFFDSSKEMKKPAAIPLSSNDCANETLLKLVRVTQNNKRLNLFICLSFLYISFLNH